MNSTFYVVHLSKVSYISCLHRFTLLANKTKMFYGMPSDPELLHALNDDGDSEEEGEITDKEGKEKPKVFSHF